MAAPLLRRQVEQHPPPVPLPLTVRRTARWWTVVSGPNIDLQPPLPAATACVAAALLVPTTGAMRHKLQMHLRYDDPTPCVSFLSPAAATASSAPAFPCGVSAP